MELLSKWLDENRYTNASFGRELAEHMKLDKAISYQTIAHWRSGSHKPHIDTAFAIATFTKEAVPIEAWKPQTTH